VLLVETLLRLSEKMEKFFEKFNINNSWIKKYFS
jgi:hypothetical protein